LFTVHYWYTCSSTVGLSLRGQWLSAGLGLVINLLEDVVLLSEADRGVTVLVIAAVAATIGLVQPLLALKALCRVEVGHKGWRPHIRREKATHRERASARMDARMDWRIVAIVGIFP
jgi:hypothetical protein